MKKLGFSEVVKSVWMGILFFIFLTTFGCNGDKQEEVPYRTVDIRINLSSPDFASLSGVGGFVYITGGSKGIFLRRKSFEEYTAYDRNCTFNALEGCVLTIDSNNFYLKDSTCCGSRFSLDNGNSVLGPASRTLRTYRTTLNGNTLFITN